MSVAARIRGGEANSSSKLVHLNFFHELVKSHLGEISNLKIYIPALLGWTNHDVESRWAKILSRRLLQKIDASRRAAN